MRLFMFAAIAFGVAIVLVMVTKLNPHVLPGTASLYEGPAETNLDLNSPDNTLYLDLKGGRVTIQMRPDLAPLHVARMKELVRQGFYDGLTFHRVLDGFMAQGGDPDGTGMGGSGVHLKGEFSKEKFVRGVVGMGRAQSVDSADSQFYIMLGDGRWLDKKYTIWGQVTDGMAFVDAIKKGDRKANGKIDGEADTIVRMQIAGDAAKN